MNEYCNPLNFTMSPLTEDYNIFEKTTLITIVDLKFVNLNIREILNTLGIKIAWIELFCREPLCPGTIHTDGIGGDFTKINWVFNGRGSKMDWFEIKNTDKNQELLSIPNAQYSIYGHSDVIQSYSDSLSYPCLVQVGKPHQVTNPYERRHAVSFILTDNDGNRLTMAGAQALLKEYIL